MTQTAIYIDTCSFLNSDFFEITSDINHLVKILQLNDHMVLLNNDILEMELRSRIENSGNIPPQLQNFLSREEIKKIAEQISKNKKRLNKAIKQLFSSSVKFNLEASSEEIREGCRRYYKKEAPWIKKKEDEWKDYFVQISLIKIANSDYKKLIVASRDAGFLYLNDLNLGIDVQKTPLRDFVEHIKLYAEEIKEELKEEKEGFLNYLTNKIYTDLEFEIAAEIEEDINADKGVCGEMEVYIEDIKILNEDDLEYIICEVRASISGEDITNATWDHEDRKYYNVEQFSYDVKYEAYLSFEGEYSPTQLFKDKKDGSYEDKNVVSLSDKIKRIV